MIRRRLRSRRAQGLIEFAVIFPIFAFLLSATVDGGIVMGRYNDLNNAAKEGARLAAVGAPLSGANSVVDRVMAQAHGKLDSAAVACGPTYGTSAKAICVDWIAGPSLDGAPGAAPGEVGSSVRVKIRYHYTPLTPLIRQFASWDIEVCAIQRLERPVDAPPNTSADTSCSGGAATPTPVSATSTLVPTDTPTLTDTPAPTDTAVPTDTPLPATSTNTPAAPTATRTPCPSGDDDHDAHEHCEHTATAQARTATAAAWTPTPTRTPRPGH